MKGAFVVHDRTAIADFFCGSDYAGDRSADGAAGVIEIVMLKAFTISSEHQFAMIIPSPMTSSSARAFIQNADPIAIIGAG